MRGVCIWSGKNILKFGRAIDHLFCKRAGRDDLQAVFACKLYCLRDELVPDVLAAKLFVNAGVIDRDLARSRAEIFELGEPLAVLLEKKHSFLFALFMADIHFLSVNTNEARMQMLSARDFYIILYDNEY